MSFKVCNRVNFEIRPMIGALKRQDLTTNLRARDPTAAIRRNGPATNDRVDAPVLENCVLMTHQHDKATALSGPEAVGLRVVNSHFRGCQRSGLSETDKFERV